MNEKQVPIPENENQEMNINADADVPGNIHLSEPMLREIMCWKMWIPENIF